jgi:methylenetetrahydrofolate dehydrogenase (NADP+)/methenyltetrahydrofolate cyclohydrolase
VLPNETPRRIPVPDKRTDNLMDGRAVAARIQRSLEPRITALRKQGVVPTLAIVFAANDERTDAYIRAKQDAAARLGIAVQIHAFPAGMELTGALTDAITDANGDPAVHGIIVQLPLPAGVDEDTILNVVAPEKDVDGLTSTNEAALDAGRELFTPATPLAILQLLSTYHIPLDGTTVAVVGQGRLVGAPLAAMLRNRGAIVRTADETTPDIASVTKGADVVVVATGTPNLITPAHIDGRSILIDAGLTNVDGTLVGDVSDEAKQVARLATPAVGGVGPVTVASLLANVVLAAEYQALQRIG